jgi:glycosyltransferase involved in cell wall biosynthesis
MCRALQDAGIDVLIATTDADGSGRLNIPKGSVELFGNVPVIFFQRELSESFKLSRSLARWLDAHVSEFDLVHVHAVFSHASIAAGRSCRRHSVPYIVRPLGTLDPWSLRRHSIRKQMMLKVAVRRLLSGASAIQYTSDEERRLAESELPWLPHGVVVPLGIDTEFFEPLARSVMVVPSPYVLALSRLDQKKGIDLLIEAFLSLADRRELSSWRLVIAGDGSPDYVARLRALADAGIARERIVFFGWASGTEKRALLNNAALFALPSAQENFGLAVGEAMAAGVPVVVTPAVNLAPEITAVGAGWVTERKAEAIAGCLGEAMTNSAERARRGAAARELAGRFTWSAVGGQLLELNRGVTRPAAGAHDRATSIAGYSA